jgi:hemerythrin-like domain-containing protein
MSPVNRLQREHEALRRTLSSARDAITVAELSEIVQARLRALTRLLTRHLRREEAAWHPYLDRLEAAQRALALSDHAEPHILLRDLEALIAAWRLHPTETLAIHLWRLLDELQERLDEEERELFPVMEAVEERTADQPLELVKT